MNTPILTAEETVSAQLREMSADLLVLDRAGKLGDPRAREALDHIEAKRLPDGTWRSGGS